MCVSVCVYFGLRTVAGTHSEPSGARAWPRAGFLARGAARRGPGAHPDSLGVPGEGHAREFPQAQESLLAAVTHCESLLATHTLSLKVVYYQILAVLK